MTDRGTISLHWTFRPWRLTAALAGLMALLAILAIGGQLVQYQLGSTNAQAFNKAFDLDEGDVPAFVAGGNVSAVRCPAGGDRTSIA